VAQDNDSEPDPSAPGFTEEAARQARLLRDAPEEKEVLDFIEVVADFLSARIT
jgi:antidote-toxin recognition MazE-like antitoxin